MKAFIDYEVPISSIVVTERMWDGRGAVVKGELQSGTLGFLEIDEGLIPVCTLLHTTLHQIYNPSANCIEGRIDPVAQTALTSDCGGAIRDADFIDDCLTQIKKEKSMNMEMKARLSNLLIVKRILHGIGR